MGRQIPFGILAALHLCPFRVPYPMPRQEFRFFRHVGRTAEFFSQPKHTVVEIIRPIVAEILPRPPNLLWGKSGGHLICAGVFHQNEIAAPPAFHAAHRLPQERRIETRTHPEDQDDVRLIKARRPLRRPLRPALKEPAPPFNPRCFLHQSLHVLSVQAVASGNICK